MGGGGVAATRALHGSIAAAAAAVFVSAAATVDIPDKLHLKATPMLFYAVPPSMPLPPLPSLSSPSTTSCSCFDFDPFSIISDKNLKSLANSSSTVGSSLSSAVSSRSPLPGSCSSMPPDASPSNSLELLLSSLTFCHVSRPFAPNLPVSSTPHSLHTWHVPMPSSFILNKKDDSSVASAKKPALTVVLLGWLGAQQKHLKKYAEWYNARGIHAVTFVVPMTDVLTFKVGGKAEEHVDRLAHHLALWLTEQGEHANGIEGEKQLMFHTFSNTGWLTYGVILEKLQERGDHLLGKIKGCVVDSAPAADPDPQIWASGFSAALLKKRSSATKEAVLVNETKEGVTVEGSQKGVLSNTEVEPSGVEAALLSVLAGFFSVFLKLPAISERLSKVVTTLSKQQPQCPQLYIYSTADKVIPVKSVEAFIEQQRKAGHVVRSCNLQSSPHVDHFRSHPQLYSEQLSNFLKE
ncbi:unnamed protein product, partial [Sphagnum balticum]